MSKEIIKKAIYTWKPTDITLKVLKVPIGGLTIIMPKFQNLLSKKEEKMKDVTPKNEPTETLALDNLSHGAKPT